MAAAGDNPALTLLAPVSGVLVPLGEVPDAVFAQRLAGDGISIDPLGARVVAPCPGRVVQVHRSGHAVTLDVDGLEIVIHVGLDTVGLRGEGFTTLVQAGDVVCTGDPLIEFDADLVGRKARSLLTQMLVANMDLVETVRPRVGRVHAGIDAVMDIVLRPGQGGEGVAATADNPQAHTAESPSLLIAAPQGLHARPAAVLAAAARRFTSDVRLVKGERDANVRSVVSIMALEVLHGESVRIVARGDDARAAVQAIAAVIRELEHEPPAAEGSATPASPRAVSMDVRAGRAEGVLRGVPASRGAAVGVVYQFRHADVVLEARASDASHERRELDAAIGTARLQLVALQARMSEEADPERAAIFLAHQELLADPDLIDLASAGIANGATAAHAWQQAYRMQAERLRALSNPLLAARATDLRDVGHRVLHLLVGTHGAGQAMPDGAIVVAEDLTPSDTASLDRTRVRGICTTMGSATSHVAILARGFGMPAVAGIDPRVLDLLPGTPVLLDGDAGTLKVHPTDTERAAVAEQQVAGARRDARTHAAAHEPAVTADLHRVEVVGNIGTVEEAQRVPALGGEGVGLLRTEFMFMERRTAPSEDEQAQAYTAIAHALGPGRILVIRTLDVGGDKPLAYLEMAAEANPFLGERGVRLTLSRPALFRTQLRAILRASTTGRIAVMFPMIATLAEWRAARDLLEDERRAMGVPRIPTGIMVETAAAALLAERFAREADFLSIGTNDLTQYTLAMDRTHPRLAPHVDALHPAVLRLIAATVAGGHAHGRWVGVCGALAADPRAVPVLVGLGVDEFSVDVPVIPAVKAQVRTLSLEQCRTTAHEALAAEDGAEVRELVERRHG